MNYYKFIDQDKKRQEKRRIKEQNKRIGELQTKLKPYTDLALLSILLRSKEENETIQ